MTTVRQCQKCGKVLSPTSNSKGLCSACYTAGVAKQPVLCAHCGKSFVPTKKGRFCGLPCFNASRVAGARKGAPPAPVPGKAWIPLTQGKFALVDDIDAPRVVACSWCAVKVRPNARGDVFYAKNTAEEFLHRFILGVTDSDVEVDHFDGDGLNCSRGNLRRTDKAGNASNRTVTAGKASGYKGVHAAGPRWAVRYMRAGHEMYGGTFADKEEAARKYDEIIRQYGDSMATYNFPRPGERSALTGEVAR